MFVPVSKPFLNEDEHRLVLEAVRGGMISGSGGNFIDTFEKKFADFCGVKYAVTTTSGTTALHLAMAILGVGPGDEVLISTFTNMATFFAVLYQGAKPIPIDCESKTLNLNPQLLEEKITSKTKGIIVVHIYGHPVDMDPVLEVAKKYNLFVVEDAAEAHGARYKGKMVGSLGDIGCFSFYANKIITTGEGGMITTNNPDFEKRAKILKSLAFGDNDKFMHQYIGYNYRMTNVQAAIGCAQMDKINDIINRKRNIAKFYLENLKDIKCIQMPVEESYAFNVYWMFNIILKDKLSGKRSLFMKELKRRGVETREDFVPFNQQEIFIRQGLTKPEDCPVVNSFFKDGLYIPSGTDITEEELRYAVEQIKEVVNSLCI